MRENGFVQLESVGLEFVMLEIHWDRSDHCLDELEEVAPQRTRKVTLFFSLLAEWFRRKNTMKAREVMRCVDHGIFLRQQKV